MVGDRNPSRRDLLAGGAAAAALAATSRARAQVTLPVEPPPSGTWTALVSLPIALQATAAAAFRFTQRDRNGEFSIESLVAAGGLLPGRGALAISDQTFFYNPVTDRWNKGPRLPVRRHHMQLVLHEDRLIALGGYVPNKFGDWQISNEVWSLDSLTSGSWRRERPTPFLQAEGVAATVDGRLVYVGGQTPYSSQNRYRTDHQPTSQVWRYDQGAWIEMGDKARSPVLASAAAAAYEDSLYIFGGVDGQGEPSVATYRYNPHSDSWAKLKPMPRKGKPPGRDGQWGGGAARIGSKIYVVGGEWYDRDGGGLYSEVLEYDPAKDSWRSVAPWPRPRHSFGCAAMGGKLYAAGGGASYGWYNAAPNLDRFSI
jgi:N-acetylneuraminic acid mutarotase